MAKDLIIGAASGYTWDKLKYWVNSIRKTRFEGDVVLVGTDMKKETIDRLTKEGIILSLYGKQNANGDIESPKNNAPHVERFFYLWNYLNETEEEYLNVVTTDTRDVIFQLDPSKFLEDGLVFHNLVASSEGMRYENEVWNNRNLLETFGPYFHNVLKSKLIYNVGTIAGQKNYVKGLLLLLFQMSINRPIAVVDQAVYNFILNTPPFDNDTWFTTNKEAWGIQLGTTLEAVKAGSGDLGMACAKDPSKIILYQTNYEDDQPIYVNDKVVNHDKVPFVIVHQWDRVPQMKEIVEKTYGDI